MAGLFSLLFLLFLILWPISVFKPSLFKKLIKNTTGRKNAMIFGFFTLLLFSLTAITAPESIQVQNVKGAAVSSAPTVSSATNTPSPTLTLTPTATPTVIKLTATPTPYIFHAQSTTQTSNTSSGSWACNCSKTCTEISSCAEAQYQLNNCGCSQRDGDHDGIACDSAPLHCQN